MRKNVMMGIVSMIMLVAMAIEIIAIPPIACEFYGNVYYRNGSNSSIGTNITIEDIEGNVCGSFVVITEGRFGLLSCNGDNTDSSADEGPGHGENVIFKINNLTAYVQGDITWTEAAYKEVNLTRNFPPVLTYINDLLARSKELFSFTIEASDADGDTLSFSSNSSLFVIDSETGEFSFTPTYWQRGNYTINFTVSDGLMTDSQLVNLQIYSEPECGDGECDELAGETCNTCPQDCGECPAVSGADEGEGGDAEGEGGGGGTSATGTGSGTGEGGTTRKFTKGACLEKWECGEWSDCLPLGIQQRICKDDNNCGTTKNKPKEVLECNYIATCYDGLFNGNETDVDCGDGCPKCENNKRCRVDNDCKSGFCHKGVCKQPSCDDGIMNQDEEDVDCGGVCGPCELKRYAKLPRIEKTDVVKVLRAFPWLLLWLSAMLIGTTVIGDRIYVRKIRKLKVEDYKRKLIPYKPKQRRLYKFAIDFGVIAAIAMGYIYWFSYCIECMISYVYYPIGFSIITPLLVSIIMRKVMYYDYRKKRKEEALVLRHKNEKAKMVEIQNNTILEFERGICKAVFDWVKEGELQKEPYFYEKIKELYDSINKLRMKHAEASVFLETDKMVIDAVSKISRDKVLGKLAREYPEFESVRRYLVKIATMYKKNKKAMLFEEGYLQAMEAASMPHLKTVIASSTEYTEVCNALVDIYRIYERRLALMYDEEDKIVEEEMALSNKISMLSTKADFIDEIRGKKRRVTLFNDISQLHDLYVEKQKLHADLVELRKKLRVNS